MRIRMTKEVLVTISGLQFSPETESESVELITSGSYYKKNGKHYIIYDEVNEGFSETTRNIIKLKDDFMDITRRGVSNVHMMFEKNRKNVTYYYTPYGSLLIGIDAKVWTCRRRKMILMSRSITNSRSIMSIWQTAVSQ